MNLLEKENIFLLEFMVDCVAIDANHSWDSKVLNAETCVGFSFLKYGPFYIGDDDFIPTKKWVVNGCSGCGNVKNGKSILFSLTPKMVEDIRNNFMVKLEVLKRMPGFTPDMVFLGSTTAPLMELFGQLLETVQKGEVPTTKTLKDTFVIKDNNGEKVGRIGAYVRMSCFGKVIVTKFQMNYEAETVNFSAKEGKRLYKYNRKDNCNNFRTDVCHPGYPCSPCCPAVQAAKRDYEKKGGRGLSGDGKGRGGSNVGDEFNFGDGSTTGDGKSGGGKGKGKGGIGSNSGFGKGGRRSEGGYGKGRSSTGSRSSKGGYDKSKDRISYGSEDSQESKKSKSTKKHVLPDIPFIGGPSLVTGKPELVSCPCPPCDPCPPCTPCPTCCPPRGCNPC